MSFKNIINWNQDDIAFIIGNGINRFHHNSDAISWENLLIKLWNKFVPDVYSEVPTGITLTEFYDLLDLADVDPKADSYRIQKEVVHLLKEWIYRYHHTLLVTKAIQINAPILTTNFDLNLTSCVQTNQYYTDSKYFTDFYPWTTYFGSSQLNYPTDGFGIWFINGFVKYYRSIRLGLSHYMGCVEKARNFLHKGEERTLFSGKNQENWLGAKTWLHILFNKSICIFGLSMEENEVFLRWLLIERAKYYKRYPDRKKKGWYVAPKAERPNDKIVGKIEFLKGIGFELIETENYEEIYEVPWE